MKGIISAELEQIYYTFILFTILIVFYGSGGDDGGGGGLRRVEEFDFLVFAGVLLRLWCFFVVFVVKRSVYWESLDSECDK